MRLISAALAVGLALAAVQAQAKDPLRDQLKSDQDGLCYRRDYDAAHLRRVPGQATQTVLLSFRKDATRIMLRQRGRDHYIVAACDWSDKAAYDTSGRLMIKAFKGPGGYDCIVMISPESAEEGGYVLLDLAGGDGSSLTLHADFAREGADQPQHEGTRDRSGAQRAGSCVSPGAHRAGSVQRDGQGVEGAMSSRATRVNLLALKSLALQPDDLPIEAPRNAERSFGENGFGPPVIAPAERS